LLFYDTFTAIDFEDFYKLALELLILACFNILFFVNALVDPYLEPKKVFPSWLERGFINESNSVDLGLKTAYKFSTVYVFPKAIEDEFKPESLGKTEILSDLLDVLDFVLESQGPGTLVLRVLPGRAYSAGEEIDTVDSELSIIKAVLK
jgi:hypothetical protein